MMNMNDEMNEKEKQARGTREMHAGYTRGARGRSREFYFNWKTGFHRAGTFPGFAESK